MAKKSAGKPVTWVNETRRLGDLIPYEKNPKTLKKKQADGLKISIRKFGLAIPLLISPNNDIYDGNQRTALLTAMEEFGPDAIVDVRVSSRVLTEDEQKELIVRLVKNTAEFDFDALANNYEVKDLLDWGFASWEIGVSDEGAKSTAFDATNIEGAIETGDTKTTYIIYVTFDNDDDFYRGLDALSFGVRNERRQNSTLARLDGQKHIDDWENILGEYKNESG
jgi:hypothetical protein